MEVPFLTPISAPLIVTFALIVVFATVRQPVGEELMLEVIDVANGVPLQGSIKPVVTLNDAVLVHPAALDAVTE
jgi:hypothetical protein